MVDNGPGAGVQRLVPAQVHVNGDPRPRERETDILDDMVLMSGHDLRSVDSLGTLSSSCHKSSQNSLLSDGFCSPGVEEQQQQPPIQHLIQQQQQPPATPTMEEYERTYVEARRGGLGPRSASVASSTPGSAAPKQQLYRQGSYSTHTWVRQQQMVAAQQYAYMPEETPHQGDINGDRYPGDKPDGGLPKPSPPTVAQREPMETPAGSQRTVEVSVEQPTATAVNNNNNNIKRDEEFNSLTVEDRKSVV